MMQSSVSGAGLFGVLGNVFLTVIKLCSGFVFQSQAMIADGVNSLMDIFASFLTLIGGRISNKPRDKDHHFGHEKAEFIFSLFISITMIFSALFIFAQGFQGILHGHHIEFSILLFVVCGITILVKLFLYFYTRKIYQHTKSLLIYSNMIDHRNDILLSFLTFFSLVLSYFQVEVVDSLVSIFISLWIGYSGVHIFFDSYSVLMDHSMNEAMQQRIQTFILSHEDILGITKFETVVAGYRYLLVLSILVDGNFTTFRSHEIADTLEQDILKEFPDVLTVTIHVNPKQVKN